jgi:hypothetical protein
VIPRSLLPERDQRTNPRIMSTGSAILGRRFTIRD